jgi:hypothetical protein
METVFKGSDDVLKQLVTARREEIVRLQKSEVFDSKSIKRFNSVPGHHVFNQFL